MAGTDICWFSGTGNSLAVARDLARGLGARLVAVAAARDRGRATATADSIGFVFPIYDFKAPAPVLDLVSRMEGLDAKHLFAVCTYGIAPGGSLRHFDRAVRSRGGRLAAGFAVAMPHNGVGCGAVTAAERARRYGGWNARRDAVCAAIRERRPGTIDSGGLARGLCQSWIPNVLPPALKLLACLALKGGASLAFTAAEACDGCGTCRRVCPAGNITVTGGRPAWSDRCAGCFACLHWCPRGAVSLGGRDLGIRQYHHPEVTVGDMAVERPGGGSRA